MQFDFRFAMGKETIKKKKKKIQNEKKKYSEMQASASCAYSVIHLIIVQLECCTIIWDHLEKCKLPSIQ